MTNTTLADFRRKFAVEGINASDVMVLHDWMEEHGVRPDGRLMPRVPFVNAAVDYLATRHCLDAEFIKRAPVYDTWRTICRNYTLVASVFLLLDQADEALHTPPEAF